MKVQSNQEEMKWCNREKEADKRQRLKYQTGRNTKGAERYFISQIS